MPSFFNKLKKYPPTQSCESLEDLKNQLEEIYDVYKYNAEILRKRTFLASALMAYLMFSVGLSLFEPHIAASISFTIFYLLNN